MHTSRMSSKGQVTIPKEFREVLALRPGDLLTYDVKDGILAVRKIDPFDTLFHEALGVTLAEWDSEEDNEAFRDL